MDTKDLYIKYIISPLEREIKKEKNKIRYKKRFFTSKKDSEYLKELESLLLLYYQKFSDLEKKKEN